MAWTQEMVLYVRHLIDDLGTSPTYDDSRLEETIIIATQLAKLETNFSVTYTVDLDACTLTPDPTESPRDDGFITIVILKTACLILNAEAKTKAGQAVRVSDGASSIDMSGAYKATEERAKRMCEEYKMAVLQYNAGNSRAGHAIMTPRTVENIVSGMGNFT